MLFSLVDKVHLEYHFGGFLREKKQWKTIKFDRIDSDLASMADNMYTHPLARLHFKAIVLGNWMILT